MSKRKFLKAEILRYSPSACVLMFGTQEVACQSCINTTLPKSADIKHLGAATAVCVDTYVCFCVSVMRRCLSAWLISKKREFIAGSGAGRGRRAESLEDQVQSRRVKSLG